MQKPNFIIIGAQKCGTTSLYKYLTKHPQILPATKKEVHFFDLNFDKGMSWYYSHFSQKETQNKIITGEASPYYIFHPHAPQRISQSLPDIKLIVLLRNPVDRAVSHYYHNRQFRKLREPLSFEEAIQQESSRIEPEINKIIADENYKSLSHRYYSYLSRGIYIQQLVEWMKFFPRQSFLILKSEELWENPGQKMKQVWDFLGVPSQTQEIYEKHNYRRHKNDISAATRMMLTEYFQPYNQRLEEYLGQKFNWDNTAVKKSKNQESQSLNMTSITEQVSNKNQDKLSVTKIQQGEISSTQKKNQKVSRKINFKYLVVATARSGTKFMSYAFRSVGINCGHENFFGAPSKKQRYLTEEVVEKRMLNNQKLEADSSWLAVPFLNTKCVPKDVSIIHLTRHPQKVIESLIAIGFFRRNYNFYTNYALLNTPQIKSSDSELTKCCKWYLYWHRKIEESGRQLIHYRLEDPLELLFDKLSLDYERYEIFNDIKTNTRNSENRRKINLIEEIKEPDLLKEIIEMAEGYGYSITEETETTMSTQKNQQENIVKVDNKYEKEIQEKEQVSMSELKDKLHNYQSRLEKIHSQRNSKQFGSSTSSNGEITMKLSNDNSVAKKTKSKRTIPALTKDAVIFLEKFLRQKPNAKVLEFGSGISTVWLSKLTKKLVSIEHDIEWYQKVTNYLEDDNNCYPVDFRLLARPYHTVCQEFQGEFFDVIIVDGRDRAKCLEASIRVLKKGGILMVDDAQREKYKPAYNLLRDWQLIKTVSKTKIQKATYWWQKPDSDQHEKELTEVKPQAKIEIVDISFSKIDSQNLLKYHIDRPKKGDKIDCYNNQIEIIGWILGKESQPVAVEILSNGKLLQKVSINKKRPGVAKTYPQIPQAKTSGFVANIEVIGLPKESELTLQAILKNKSRVLLGSIKLHIKSDKSIGVIYIATGEKYIREACQSVASLKAQMPQMPVTIFADEDIKNSNFEQVVVIEKPHYNHVDKVQYMYASPYDYTLFIDTDTYISADFSEIFPLLDKFDIGVAHAPLNMKGFKNGVPESFQQFNSGVILYKKSPEVEQFFSNWFEWYNPPNFDQPTFREALYKSQLRIVTLPPEYNCRFPFLGVVFGTVKVLHGRHKNLPLVAQKINSKKGLRLINPKEFKKIRE
ncbi:MAG: hypothetical protein F6K40_07340 [Okeania sp. SIO3I5]|uniref:sulfotransferase domain-containing protein n=1 Tax=Okeania sp. SIO3I5 TaxID=2607805 RepID=UPI0013BC2EF0|nr:sulfotransferase domain-containing protein [Okeania sp. SIO3I5]NEQ36106.1 hypothetical protein [Okeania sp. SIO3I5]